MPAAHSSPNQDTFACAHGRTIDFDIRERFWALDALLDKIMQGQASFRARIAATR
ncbi:hypothetical protein [Bradyrhizobium sp. Arg816]|uniref:hypothetical protein n=1 Tax=Bradyrhizobium sp. Arg816 TaxID=2998491 RepID=UPI0027B9E82F|nr:hypothetical protein [Bradyrhizobium sp. Arg816]